MKSAVNPPEGPQARGSSRTGDNLEPQERPQAEENPQTGKAANPRKALSPQRENGSADVRAALSYGSSSLVRCSSSGSPRYLVWLLRGYRGHRAVSRQS